MKGKNEEKKTSAQAREDSAAKNRTTVRILALKVPKGVKQVMKEGAQYWVSEDSALMFEGLKVAKIDDKAYTAKQAVK